MNEYRKDVNEVTQDMPWTIRKVFTKVIIPMIFIFIVLGGIFFVINIARQPGRVVEKTLDADNVLYNYEWFKQTYQDVVAIDVKITNAEQTLTTFTESAGPRTNWSFEDKDEYGRLGSVILGLKNQRQDLVAMYNARSKMANRAIFKSSELPEQLF